MTTRLIAIDLDGTLLDDNKNLSKENHKALEEAHNKGVKIVLCTGRPYKSMKHLVDELNFLTEEDYIITFNGSLVQEALSGKIIYENTLDFSDLKLWYKATQEVKLPITAIDTEWVYENKDQFSGHESIYASQISNAPSKEADLMDFTDDHRFNKLVIGINEEYLDKQFALISSDLKADYEIVKSHPYLLEIGKKGVSKGSALKALSELVGISVDQIMGIGDEHNDISMLEVAGISVAMENAVSAAKEKADFITKSNNDSGVAYAIRHYLGEENN